MSTVAATANRDRRKPQQTQLIPKGCLAVKVGEADGEKQRFVVPVIWFNHPLFGPLLKRAEDEYGFEQIGVITIPCKVDHFRSITSIIEYELHHQNQHFGCFRVWAR